MTTMKARPASSATKIHADRTVLKHLGDWTADRAFHAIGWTWGGDWRSLKDYQHFSANGL